MKKSPTVFIADDDPDDVELLVEAIGQVDESATCLIAYDGEQAIQKLKSSAFTLPDIIFLDLNMPRINGMQCLAEIRKLQKLKDVPVVIYSTSSIPNDIEETKKLGAAHFLTKPSDYKALIVALSGIFSAKPHWAGEQ
jgi:CheY-like chemotaxis protein